MSAQGRPILAANVGGDQGKPVVWIQAMLHGREWGAGAAALYLLDRLLASGQEKSLPDQEKWHFVVIPVANPDGYAWTWQGERFWRKNRGGCIRMPTGASLFLAPLPEEKRPCGTDLNRNFAEHWSACAVDGGDDDDDNRNTQQKQQQRDDYRGPREASEPETRALQRFFASQRGCTALALDVHTYGQLVLYPPGWTSPSLPSSDNVRHRQAAKRIVASLQSRRQIEYSAMSIAELYRACGTATDWFASRMHDLCGCPEWLSLGIELRPGFLLQQSEQSQLATGEEEPDAFPLRGFSIDPREIRGLGEDLVVAVCAALASEDQQSE